MSLDRPVEGHCFESRDALSVPREGVVHAVSPVPTLENLNAGLTGADGRGRLRHYVRSAGP